MHVDPGSPAGKEYAIPIERARREAAGGTGIAGAKSTGRRGAAVPIFGQGIKPQKLKPRKRKRARVPHPQRAVPRADGVASPAVQAALRTPSTTGWTAGIIGAVVVAAALVALAIALPWLSSRDEGLPVDGELLSAAARLVVAYGVAAAFGVSVGALLHSQIGAVVGIFAWFLVVEPIVVGLIGLAVNGDENPVAGYVPGSAMDAVVSTGGTDVPRPLVGTAVALGYAAAIFLAGAALTVRRDVAS